MVAPICKYVVIFFTVEVISDILSTSLFIWEKTKVGLYSRLMRVLLFVVFTYCTKEAGSNCRELKKTLLVPTAVDSAPSYDVNGIELTNEALCREPNEVDRLLTDTFRLFCISP
jgi:hypothetical protein